MSSSAVSRFNKGDLVSVKGERARVLDVGREGRRHLDGHVEWEEVLTVRFEGRSRPPYYVPAAEVVLLLQR